jgi:hypothetical protein
MDNPKSTDEYDKAALDAMTDKGAEIMRESLPLPPLLAEYAGTVAEYLAVQFPDSAELPRIVLACAQYMSALGAEGVGSATLVRILGAAGLKLGDAQAEETCPGGC